MKTRTPLFLIDRLLLAALALLAAPQVQAQVTTNTWQSAAGNGAWFTTGNWSAAATPTATSVVRFTNSTAGVGVGINVGNASTNNAAGFLLISNGTVTVSNSSGGVTLQNSNAVLRVHGWLENSQTNLIVNSSTSGHLIITNGNASTTNATIGRLPLVLMTGGVIDVANSGARVSLMSEIRDTSGTTNTITKTGAGTLTIGGTNVHTWGGGVVLSAGVLQLNNSSALGAESGLGLTINGGSIDNASGGAITLSNYVQTWGGNFTFLGSTNLNLGAGAVNLTGSRIVTVSSSTLAVGGTITNTGGITKDGAGTLILNGANTYSGGTLVSAGVLIGSTASLQGAITNNAALVMSQSADGTYGGALSGNGNFTKSGSGTVTLGGNNSGYGGAIDLQAGGLVAAHNNALGSGALTLTNGSIQAANGVSIANNFTIGAAGGLQSLYSQNFNGMGTSATAALPTGWKMSAAGAGTTNTFWTNTGNVSATTAAASSGTPTAGGSYNWGFSNDTGNRSIGFMSSGSYDEPNSIMFAFTNTTGQTITNFTVSFDYFRFRTNTTAISNVFFMSASSTSWGSALGTNNWGTGSSGYNFAPSAVSLSNTIALTIINGGVGYMMWTFDPTTTGSSQGLGLDNLVINTLGEPTGSGTLGISEAGTATFSGAITNNTAATLTAASGGTATFSGAISGAGSVTKTGEGTVTLSGNNTFGGVLTVAEGKLTVSSVNNASQDGVLGNSANAVVLGDSGQTGFLHYVGNTNASTDKTFTAATGGTAGIEASNAATILTLSGAIGGAGNVQKGGAGTLLLAGNNTFTGALNVHDGTLEIASINNNSANGPLGNSTNPVSLGKSGTANVSTLHYTGGTASTTKGFSMASDATAGVINVANSGTTLTVSGPITGSSGSGLTKTGIGRLSLSGSSSYNGATAVSAGDLNLSGGSITNSAVTVASGASLSGYGSVGTIGGAGAINPGNSPGILTTPQVNPSAGTSFNFEMTGTAPIYSNAASSTNDLIRITGATPFSQALAVNGTNSINIYFSGGALFTGVPKTITGGFFTDQSTNLASSISGATYNYYFANTNGPTTYNGASYYNKAQYESLVLGTNMSITVTTVAQTANFGSGDINGQVMQVQVIPEPSIYALLGLSAAAFGAYRWRRRRRG